MARLIKSGYVEMKDKVIIGIQKDEKKDFLPDKSSENFSENVNENLKATEAEENQAKEKIQKLEQLKKKLENEAQELSKNTRQLADQMLQDANEEARRIIEEARDKAQQSYREKIEQAIQDGKKSVIEKYDSLLKEGKEVIEQAETYKKSTIENSEKDIINLVLKCVEKIIREKIEKDDQMVTNVIMSAIADFHSRSSLLIKISSEDFGSTKLLRDKILGTFPTVKDIQFKIMDGYKKGDIEIESVEGTVNPSIEKQIIKLREEFNKLIEGE